MDLQTRVDRSLVRAGGRSERYLQLALATPPGETKRLPINLALVLDRSGSMTGEKLARAKEAASFVVRHLTSADRVAVVAYDDAVQVVQPSARLSHEVKAAMLRAIDRLDTGGSTNLAGGWLTGCGQVAEHQQPAADGRAAQLDRALLLTDGLANVGIVDPAELCHHAAELRRRGIVTSTLGIGHDFNEELLEALARHGGGRFQYVETAKHIPDCVQGELGEILSVAARRVEVTVCVPDGVRIAEQLNELPMAEVPGGIRIRLDDVLAGDTKRLLLRLAFAGGEVGHPYRIDATVRWLDVASGEWRQDIFPEVIYLVADDAASESQAPDAEVMAEVALLLAARERERAVKLGREGRAAEARQVLRTAASSLSAMAPASPQVAQASAQLAAFAAPEAPLGEAAFKELHYQTYLARQGRRRYDQSDRSGDDESGRKPRRGLFDALLGRKPGADEGERLA